MGLCVGDGQNGAVDPKRYGGRLGLPAVKEARMGETQLESTSKKGGKTVGCGCFLPAHELL